jgi:hypothetical protein
MRFQERDIPVWAARNPDGESDRRLTTVVGPAARSRGYLTRAEFLEVCAWKSPRSKPHCSRNSERAVRTVTRAAFATVDEGLKIELLRLLEGVEWPTASTILHFCDERPYPIVDVRALWSLGFAKSPRVTMEFWLAYLEFTRGLAARSALSMRTVDLALWNYSKERQRKGKP